MSAGQRYDRFEIPGLQRRPDWWQVRPEEVTTAVEAAAKGEVRRIATTPGGFPVWAVAYGPPQARPGTATWGIGSNSRTMASYRTSENDPQVVMLLCGVHGAETESVAGAVNMLSLLETGRDLKGNPRPHLLDLMSRYRVVILPCVNMDGRAVSPDHLRGADLDQFRRASQGYWTDGTEIGYPACKEYAPLPLERVGHPGGYPNADGYNIQHDCCPGDLRTPEARGVLKLVADEQADLVLNLHSHTIGGQVLGDSLLAYPLHVHRVHVYKQRVFDALEAKGLRPAPVYPIEQRGGINLNTACVMASGGLTVTFEQSAAAEWSFDEVLEIHYTVIETFLEWGLKEPFSPRQIVARGQTE
ncbi:MAG: hypothetical protein GXY74_04930 [Phycisphaerae bacterium]|nr:hypothetical protein [Phycisphaerae bacterium]